MTEVIFLVLIGVSLGFAVYSTAKFIGAYGEYVHIRRENEAYLRRMQAELLAHREAQRADWGSGSVTKKEYE